MTTRERSRGIARQRGGAVGRKGPPPGRRAIAAAGGRKGSGRRSEIDHYSAWDSRKPATPQGQSVAGYRRDRRAVDGWHSFLVTDARATPPVAADYRQAATPCPHHAGSRLSDRGAERHHGKEPWTSARRLHFRVPSVRAGGTAERGPCCVVPEAPATRHLSGIQPIFRPSVPGIDDTGVFVYPPGCSRSEQPGLVPGWSPHPRFQPER